MLYPLNTKVTVCVLSLQSPNCLVERQKCKQFPVNMESVSVAGFTLCYTNTRNKSQPGEITEDFPEKVSPELGTEGYRGVGFIYFWTDHVSGVSWPVYSLLD